MTLVLMMFFSLIPATTNDAKADPQYFTITLHSNCSGGHIGSSTGPVVKDLQISYRDRALDLKKIDTTKAYCSGYVFLGWFSKSTATGSGCKKVTTSNYANELHLYAHWAKVESSLNFNDLGGTSTTKIYATPGHTFAAKNPGCASWITGISVTTGTGSTSALSSASVTTVKATAKKWMSVRNINGRGTTIRLTDSFSLSMSVGASQSSAYTRIENTLKQKRGNVGYNQGQSFFNECAPGQYSSYNFFTCRLFGDVNGKNTWCTDSALVDLLNRALTYDQRIASDFHYDLRDVLLTNCNNTSWIGGLKISKNSSTGFAVYENNGNSGGEKLNYDATKGPQQVSLNFSNKTYGAHGKAEKKYTVIIDQNFRTNRNTSGNNTNYNAILKLLESHPEGLWIQVKHKGEGDHSFMIVGYDSALWFVDNGNGAMWNGSTGIIRYSSLSDHSYANEQEMLNSYLLSVGYVTR